MSEDTNIKVIGDDGGITSFVRLSQLDLTGDKELNDMLFDCIKTMQSKGKEYTGGSPDRLNNFRQAAKDVDLPMEKVWYIFINKHWRALQSYIKNGCKVQSNETIQSRIMDCIVYLLLFNKMTLEIESKQKANEHANIPALP